MLRTTWYGKLGFGGAPGRARTCDLLIRSQTLYPTELRVPEGNGKLFVANGKGWLVRLFTLKFLPDELNQILNLRLSQFVFERGHRFFAIGDYFGQLLVGVLDHAGRL